MLCAGCKQHAVMPIIGSVEFAFAGKKFSCPENLYYPSEDSYLLARSVKIAAGSSVIDLGCGSGIQAINALLQGAKHVTCIDTDPAALEAAKNNASLIGAAKKVKTIRSDLLEKCDEMADFIIFNPPYVPSHEIKYAALDGGKKGREILDRFLLQFPKNLKRGGTCYFLQTDINGYALTEKKLSDTGFAFKIIARERGFFEELAVYECSK